MNTQAVIDLIYRVDLKEARKAVRPFIRTDPVASKVFYRLDDILKGHVQDIYGSCKRIVFMLQNSNN